MTNERATTRLKYQRKPIVAMKDIEIMRKHGFLTADNKEFTQNIHKATSDEKAVAEIFGALYTDSLTGVDIPVEVDISKVTFGIQDFLQRYLNPTKE